jgi:hypothetical protein
LFFHVNNHWTKVKTHSASPGNSHGKSNSCLKFCTTSSHTNDEKLLNTKNNFSSTWQKQIIM